MHIEKKPLSLKLNKEFKRAYYRGKSKACPYFVCYLFKNRGMGLRYGITASKKIGNAVTRNRARRLLRAAFFSLDHREMKNIDLVFVARERLLEIKSPKAAAQMKNCIDELLSSSGPVGKKKSR